MKRISKESIPDQVFNEIKAAILDGTFGVGQKLPSENELCAMLGVSRPSIKGAIQRLLILGLIETRPGDGSYVKEFKLSELFNQISDFIITEDSRDDVNEYRIQMDLLYIRLAIDRITEEELNQMDQLAAQMAQCLQDGNKTQFDALDFKFHSTIVKATRNSFFVNVFNMTKDVYIRFLLEVNETLFDLYHNHREQYFDIHTHLVEAIRNRNYESCENLLSIGAL